MATIIKAYKSDWPPATGDRHLHIVLGTKAVSIRLPAIKLPTFAVRDTAKLAELEQVL